MTKSEREKIEALASKSLLLRETWLRERQEILAEQLAANDEIRKRWQHSNAIESKPGGTVNGAARRHQQEPGPDKLSAHRRNGT